MLDWVWLVWACIKTSLVGSLAFVIASLLLGTPTHWDAVLWHVVPFALQQVSQSFPPPWPPYAGVAFREVYSFSVPPYCFFTQRNLRSFCQCGSFFLFLMVFLWAAKPLHPVTQHVNGQLDKCTGVFFFWGDSLLKTVLGLWFVFQIKT